MQQMLTTCDAPELAARLVDRNFAEVAGELCVGGVAVSEIVSRHSAPLFIYDRQTLQRRWSRLREALPEAFAVYYSIKANPNQRLLRFYLDRGCGLEIASGGELYQALQAGCDPSNILFAGPGKTEDELQYALASQIGEIHVESPREACRIAAICSRRRQRAAVALRINPSGDAQGGAMRMGGKPAPFGVDEETLDDVLTTLLAEPALDLTGIHLFTGTQILDHSILLKQYRKAIQLAKRVATRIAKPLRTIDFGGGLGIPYFGRDSELNLQALADGVAALTAEIRREPLLAEARLIVEPGRFLVGEAGLYVTRVNDVKQSRGKKFVVVDGGMHHHLAASGNLGQTIKRNFPIAIANKLDRTERETVDVVGPLCTPLDILARSISLPPVEVGDLVTVFQSGAYARAASPLQFLSHPAPPEVWIEDGRDHLIRRRGRPADYLADQPGGDNETPSARP